MPAPSDRLPPGSKPPGFLPNPHFTGRVENLLVLVVLPAIGQVTFQFAIRRFLSNALQNGFFEEFLFRGALQTRLGYLMNPAGALVLQALLFGVWHLGANLEQAGGDWGTALALCVLSQGITGLIYGLVFRRTRNLLAPSCAHIGMNALGQTLFG